jgi:hypothetical protein
MFHVLTKGMAGVAAIRHHPLGHIRQTIQQRNGVRQFVRLSWRQT